MDKQYSVQFFSAFVEALQRLCRDYLDFDQAVEIGGYLSVEIDNFRKERYVISEMLQQTGNVISESYCTKAFKTHGRCCAEKNPLRERHSNVSEFGGNFTSTSDSQISGLQASDSVRYTQPMKRARHSLLRTNSGEAEVSGDDYNSDIYPDDCSPGKKRAPLLSVVQRMRNTSAASNDCAGEKSGEEERNRQYASTLHGSPKSKRERIQSEEQASSSSTYHNSAASFTEASFQGAPLDSSSKDCLGDPFSVAVSASTAESIHLPLGTVIKDEPGNDNDDCVMVGSSEEDSNLLDSSEVSYIADAYQSSQQTGGYSQSTAYTESQTSSPADRPQVDSTMKSAKKVKTQYTNYSCGVCRYSTYKMSNYKRHLKLHSVDTNTDDNSTVCDHCGKKYSSMYALRLHVQTKHEQVFKFHCEACGRGFNQFFQFRSHCSSHTKIPSNRCEFCRSYFQTRYLKRHMAKCKDNPKFKTDGEGAAYRCEECLASFTTESRLKCHVTGKHKPPTYKCPVCEKMFAWRSSLKVHMKCSHGFAQ